MYIRKRTISIFVIHPSKKDDYVIDLEELERIEATGLEAKAYAKAKYGRIRPDLRHNGIQVFEQEV